MRRLPPSTFATLVVVPENRSAAVAAQDLAESASNSEQSQLLFLHGPPGSGKTHLVSAVAERWLSRTPRGVLTVLAAADWNALAYRASSATDDVFQDVRGSDFLIVEDLQHLSAIGARGMVPILDELSAHGALLAFTASVGPRCLGFSERLASRLAGGLVVGLEPLQATSRLAVLCDKAQRRQLAVSHTVLAWLAEHTRGGRQLEGALARLEALTRRSAFPLDVAHVAAHFERVLQPTIERIAKRVSAYFRIELRQLRSERRRQHILLPRQIGMYLARRLTGLSLEQIGDYFGGRDHSTVLHACRKVEHAIALDPAISGNVRQLYLDLA